MGKLDYMIDMQRKQEENLNFFKSIFGDSRRVKTDGSLIIASKNDMKQPFSMHHQTEK